jgi:hypothetical protein
MQILTVTEPVLPPVTPTVLGVKGLKLNPEQAKKAQREVEV